MSEETIVENDEGEVLPEEDALEPESSPETADSTDEQPKKGNKVQERINQITREKYEERRAREEAEKKLAEYEAKLAEHENQIPPKPKYDEYDTDEAYESAVRAHERKVVEVENRRQQGAQTQQQQDDAFEASKQKIQQSLMEAKHIPGLMEIAQDPQLPIDRDMIEVLSDSDKAAEIIYHLGTHLDKAYEIMQMSPARKTRELLKLESEIEKPTPKKVTTAPNPPDPIGGSEGSFKDPKDMSMDEWVAYRNAKKYGGS